MQTQKQWLGPLASRVVSHGILGGLLTAIVGAVCVGAAGAAIGAILDVASAPAQWDGGFMMPGAFVGMSLGAWSGILGAIIYGIGAAKAGPGRCIREFTALCARVSLGQFVGTLSALTCYLAFAFVVSQIKTQPFIGTVEDNAELIVWGAPALMMCGALAGALLFGRAPKTAREAGVAVGAA